MLTLLSALPIILVVGLLVLTKLPAKVVMPLVWFFTAVFAIWGWSLSLPIVTALTALGFLESLNILIIIGGALLILNTLKATRAMDIIQKDFQSISPDARIQLIIIGFLFGAFLEGLSGFGTPAALVAPLLITLGFKPISAAVIALVYNSAPVSFGASGTPFVGMRSVVEITSMQFQQIITQTALLHVLPILVLPFLGVAIYMKFFSTEKSFKPALEILPFSLVVSIVFASVYVLTTIFFGSELPSMLASSITLIVAIFLAKRKILTPSTAYLLDKTDTDTKSDTFLKVDSQITLSQRLTAWLPYFLISVFLLITRVSFLPFRSILQSWYIEFNPLFGVDTLSWKFSYGYLPGLLPFALVAIIFMFVYRLNKIEVAGIFNSTKKQILPAVTALVFALALVQLMRYTGKFSLVNPESMVTILANNLKVFPNQIIILLSPLIAVLGAFVTGSATVSNILFSSIQSQTAISAGLDVVDLLSLQSVGSAYGNMVSIGNILAVIAVTGIKNAEGKILKINLAMAGFYTILVWVGFVIVKMI